MRDCLVWIFWKYLDNDLLMNDLFSFSYVNKSAEDALVFKEIRSPYVAPLRRSSGGSIRVISNNYNAPNNLR